MKTFRDLYISLNGTDLETFSSRLEASAKSPWGRRKDKEKELHSNQATPICFEASEGSRISPSLLFIFPRSNGALWVSNIVPTIERELTFDEYNLVLEDFYRDVVQPAIEGSKITVELTNSSVSIESVAGEAVEKAFVSFSSCANKSTGSSHPLDRNRWFEFILLAHESGVELYPDLVIRSLRELGWSEEASIGLGIQYEFAEDLLTYMNKA